MKNMRTLLMIALAAAALTLTAGNAKAQWGVSVGVSAPIDEPPVCEYGYYPTYPYGCAPYGYYGPEWFNNGIFIGAGPWEHWAWFGGGWHFWGGGGWYARDFWAYHDRDAWRDRYWHGHDYNGWRDHDGWHDRDGWRGHDHDGWRDGGREGYGGHDRDGDRGFNNGPRAPYQRGPVYGDHQQMGYNGNRNAEPQHNNNYGGDHFNNNAQRFNGGNQRFNGGNSAPHFESHNAPAPHNFNGSNQRFNNGGGGHFNGGGGHAGRR